MQIGCLADDFREQEQGTRVNETRKEEKLIQECVIESYSLLLQLGPNPSGNF